MFALYLTGQGRNISQFLVPKCGIYDTIEIEAIRKVLLFAATFTIKYL